MINANALNVVALNAAPPPVPEEVADANACEIVTRTVKGAPGTLNSATLNGVAMNAATYSVEETVTPGLKETTTSRTPGTLNGLRLNSAPLNAGITRVVEVCVPGCLYTIRTVTRGPGTFNGATLNASTLNGATQAVTTEEKVGRREVVTERKPGTLNLATLNGASLNGGAYRRVERCVPTEDCVTETRRRPGTLNMQALNRGTLNGTSYFSVTVCVDAEPDEPRDPQAYFDAITESGVGVAEFETVLTMVLEDFAVGRDEVSGTQTATIESLGRALVELDTQAAQSTTVESLAAGSVELEQSRGVTDSLERIAAGLVELSGSRGQYESIQLDGLGAGELVSSRRGYTDLFELLGVGYGEITRAGDTSFEEVVEGLLATAEVSGTRRVFEPLFTDTGTGSDEVAGTLHATQRIVEIGTLVAEVETAFLHVIRDTVEALGYASDEVVSTQLHAVKWLEMRGLGYDLLRPTPLGEAWVFNTRTLAMSRYENTGATQIVDGADGLMAATNEGVATQDDERSRTASVKWGTSDFGSQQLKSLRHVYFTAAGENALKVRTFHGYGDKLQPTLYERPLNDTAVPTVYRVDMARGQRAPMWGFELVADADTNATVLDQRVIMLIDRRRF